MILYYNRQGEPISSAEFSRLLMDQDYKRVALDEIGAYEVSTVWLGLDHQFGEGPPLIFETMVFASSAWKDGDLLREFDCRRYSTEQEAQQGHQETCTLIRATQQESLAIDTTQED